MSARSVVTESLTPVVETAGVTPGPRRGAEGVAILDSGGGGGGGDGGDESAGWAVDTDDDDDAGSAGWEEVELPQRNEDIDPEVGICGITRKITRPLGHILELIWSKCTKTHGENGGFGKKITSQTDDDQDHLDHLQIILCLPI